MIRFNLRVALTGSVSAFAKSLSYSLQKMIDMQADQVAPTALIMFPSKKVLTIDIMRGLTLFLMLFVNDLYVTGVPQWMVHTTAYVDGMGLADWVFPGFLFMVGLSIPFAVSARLEAGSDRLSLVYHILKRTVALLVIGLVMVNGDRYDASNSGLNKTAWLLLSYVSFFLIWNKYPKNSLYKKSFVVMQVAGMLLLTCMVIMFRSNGEDGAYWMITSWWGILGLIGWGYLVASVTYLFTKDRMPAVAIVFVFFVVLNMVSAAALLSWPGFMHTWLGILLDGNIPSIVLCGLLVGILLKKNRTDHKILLRILLPLGVIFLIVGFVFRNWFIISKIQGTPSWAFLCNGISVLIFCSLYFLIEVKQQTSWFRWLKPAGNNSLTTYLAPDIVYLVCWSLPINLFFYKQEGSQLLAVTGSIVWALVMIGFAAVLSKWSIRLKL